jgi:hypothetical protein
VFRVQENEVENEVVGFIPVILEKFAILLMWGVVFLGKFAMIL